MAQFVRTVINKYGVNQESVPRPESATFELRVPFEVSDLSLLPVNNLDSLSALGSVASPLETQAMVVAETNALYQFDVSSTETVDSWTVLSASDGTVGRWLLRSDALSLRPAEDGSDDWARLFGTGGAVVAAAARGYKVNLLSGTWSCQTSRQLPSNANVFCSADARIVTAIASLDAASAALITASGSISGLSTLAANVTVGANTVSSNATYASGTLLRVASVANSPIRSVYTVMSSSGVGPYTLTFERAVRFPFVSGDSIAMVSSVPTNIRWTGGTFSGLAPLYFNFEGSARDCAVSAVNFDTVNGAPADGIAALNYGSLRCRFSDLYFDGKNGTYNGGFATFGENNTLERCTVRNMLSAVGIKLGNCVGCSIVDCGGTGNAYGLAFTTDAGSGFPCYDNDIRGGTFDGNTYGVNVAFGAHDNRLRDFSASGNSLYGIYEDSGGGTLPNLDNLYSGFEAHRNTVANVLIGPGNAGGCTLENGATHDGYEGLVLQSDCVVRGHKAKRNALQGARIDGSVNVNVAGLDVTAPASGVTVGVQVTGGGGGKLALRDFKCALNVAGSIAVWHNNSGQRSEVVIDDSKASGTGCYGYYGISGATLRLGERVDFSGCTTAPITIDPSGFSRIGSDSVITLAALKAMPQPLSGTVVTVAETAAAYQFDTSASGVVDGWTVLASNDGTPGRWLLKGDRITVAPVGGTSDDWARLFAAGGAGVAAAAAGVTLSLRSGTWLAKTLQTFPNGLRLECEPKVSIVGSLGTAGGVTNSLFSLVPSVTGATTLAATPTFGSTSISVAGNVGGALIAGATVVPLKAGGLRGMSYVIQSVTGTGPYTVTLDRPIRMSFASGDQVNVYAAGVVPNNIKIIGNGAQVSGTFSRFFEMAPARRCLISGFNIDASASKSTDLTVSFDIAGYDLDIIDVNVDGGSAKNLGLALESVEFGRITRCNVNRCTGYGIALYDCVDSVVSECDSSNNTGASGIGIALTADGSNLGCFACRVQGSTTTGNGQYGIVVGNGSSYCVIDTCEVANNVNHGILIDGSGPTVANVLQSCNSRGNGLAQIAVGAGSLSTIINGCKAGRSTGFNATWNLGASVTMTGCSTVTGIVTEGDTGIFVSGAGTVISIAGCQITPYYGYALQIGAGAKVTADSCTFGTTDPTNPVMTIAGTLVMSNVHFTGGGTGISVSSGGKVRLDASVSLAGVTTPYVVNSGGSLDFGAESTPTLAGLGSIFAPRNDMTVTVAETNATYTFNTSSTGVVNSWTVLSASDGTTGKWSLKGNSISLAPIGGGSDDASRLSAAYNAAAATGKRVVLTSGTYVWASAHQLPANGLVIECCPGVTLSSSLPADGTETNAPFNYNSGLGNTVTTLTSQPAKGATTINVVDSSSALLAPGSFIRVMATPIAGGLLRLATYKIASRSIGGHTLTVDRPIKRTFPSSSLVINVTPIQNFHLYGNGMRIVGTGDRAIELVGAWECYVRDVDIDGGFQDFVCGYDLGSTKSVFENIRVNCNNIGFACVAFENAEQCTLRTAWLKNSNGQASVLLPGTVDQVIDDVKSTGGTRGVYIAVNDPTNTEGCINTRITNSSFDGSSDDGIRISDGAIDTFLENVSCCNNGNAGVHVTNTLSGIAPQSLWGRGVKTEGNVYGFLCDTSTKDMHLQEFVATDNTAIDCKVSAGGVLYVNGGLVKDNNVVTNFSPLFQSTGAGTELHLSNFHIIATGSQNIQLVQVDTAATGYIHNVVAERSAGSFGVLFQATGGSKLDLRGATRGIGGLFGVLLGAASDSLSIDAGVDLSGAANYVVLSNGASSTAPLNNCDSLPGISLITLADANTTLTWAQWHSSVLKFSGTLTGTRKIRIPALKVRQRIINGTVQTLTIIATDGFGTEIGTGANITSGSSGDVIFDGTNVITI